MPTAVKSSKLMMKLIDGTLLTGMTNIQDNSRVSDALNAQDRQFVTLYDVSIEGNRGKVLFINRNSIIWSMPIEEE
ncbi:MAG: hypothetical protein ACLFTB_06560 [Desulfovibrionales bacterium]